MTFGVAVVDMKWRAEDFWNATYVEWHWALSRQCKVWKMEAGIDPDAPEVVPEKKINPDDVRRWVRKHGEVIKDGD